MEGKLFPNVNQTKNPPIRVASPYKKEWVFCQAVFQAPPPPPSLRSPKYSRAKQDKFSKVFEIYIIPFYIVCPLIEVIFYIPNICTCDCNFYCFKTRETSP